MTSLPHMVMINSEFSLLGLKSGHHVYQCNVHAQLAGSMQAIYMPCIWDKLSDYAR